MSHAHVELVGDLWKLVDADKMTHEENQKVEAWNEQLFLEDKSLSKEQEAEARLMLEFYGNPNDYVMSYEKEEHEG